MSEETWAEVDDFVASLLATHDDALEQALEASRQAGLPEIQVSPPQARLLAILARAIGARRALEFGTLGGYSTIWLARALGPERRLVTLEASAEYAAVAAANIARAGLDEVVDIRVGPALEALPDLRDEGPFDLVFIDADKVHTPDYFAWSLERTRPGGLLIADNVVRGGTLAEADSGDETIAAQRRLHEMIAADDRVEATTIQTVGVKGYDGFTIALVGA